ncbi:5-hydroxytryptamine receptor 3A-like isoform X1 [Ranitomeya variabilis]|uniref:5-hydroxytryptamine receptor 3A-like isoform X1 n=1 Tax=Ranitomeya variabilis TaxID=490064 RepID=UPI0040577878
MSPHSLTLLLTCTLFGVSFCEKNCSFDDLIQNLSFPNPNFRPVKNWTTVTEVSIGMTLYTVVQLDTSLQSLTTLLWFNMKWINEFIEWDPDWFCSINKILLTKETLWKPDLYIYERIEDEDNSPVVPFYSLKYNGEIKVSFPLRIVSSCNLNVYKFPFDIQRCNLTFGSYIHSVQDIIMVTNASSSEVFSASLKLFVSKGDWDLKNIIVRPKTVVSGNVNYSAIYYEITLQRMAIFYIITLIVPAYVLVILDIFSMFIPMESGERLGFKITLVLGFSVLLLILNTMLPNSDVLPVLGLFCCLCMAVMMISILGCIAVSYMLMISESQPTVPLWVKSWILRYLAHVLCFRSQSFLKYGIAPPEVETYVNNRALEEQVLETKMKPERDKEDSMEVQMLKMLLLQVKKIHKNIVDSDAMNEVKTEWHAAAIVVDRLILIIYLCIVVILFIYVIIIWYI